MIEIKFKCTCLSKEAEFFTRERRDGEDIADFMKNVIEPALSNAHRTLSPLCASPKTEYLKIPVAKDGAPIGTASREAKAKYKI